MVFGIDFVFFSFGLLGLEFQVGLTKQLWDPTWVAKQKVFVKWVARPVFYFYFLKKPIPFFLNKVTQQGVTLDLVRLPSWIFIC